MYHHQVLEGFQRLYYVSKPLIQSGEMRLQNALIYVMSSYAPSAATNTGLLMMADIGSAPYLTASASASTDTFTTSSAHAMSVDASVAFKGTMPGGLIAGQRYYVVAATSTTFQISATKGGAVLDITSDGSCRAYRNLQALQRWFLTNVSLDGQNIAPMGILASVQQQSQCLKFRAFNFTSVGAQISGQDGSWWNCEIVNCPTLLLIQGFDGGPTSAYQRFYQLNLEGAFDKGLVAYGHNNVIHDLHMEGGNTGAVCVENHAETLLLLGDTYMNSAFATTTLFKRVSGDIVVENFDAISGGSTSAVLLDDQVVGDTILLSEMVGDDASAPIRRLDTGFTNSPSSGSAYRYLIRREAGGYFKFGGQLAPAHTAEKRAGTSQTGRLDRWLDSGGNEVLAVDKLGHLVVKNGPFIFGGTGSPESVLTAPIGSLYLRSDGGAATSLYVKESGAGTTGWVAK